ncbi:MAG TPA: two-component system response regulator [Elusimicrobia bacterium]|nr:two-component system response regulator [Elusimicrobiota bacterium]
MGLKVLLIDDSPLTRSILADMLDAVGHQVVGEAETGQAGLDAYQKLKPDVTTLDVSLPDMDGITVLTELKRIDPAAKVVLVTGNDQHRLQEMADRFKVLFLGKPFSIADLKRVVEAAAAGGAP